MCVQCEDAAASGDHTSEPDTSMQSQQNSPQAPSVPEPPTQPPLSPAETDNVLSNTPPPVNKAPADRLVPLDLQPFVRSAAIISSADPHVYWVKELDFI